MYPQPNKPLLIQGFMCVEKSPGLKLPYIKVVAIPLLSVVAATLARTAKFTLCAIRLARTTTLLTLNKFRHIESPPFCLVNCMPIL
jgi:hypothetical protein